MAKKSLVQVTATVTGDGINSVNAPAPTVNATLAPSGGPIESLLTGGNDLFTPPTTTGVGVLITVSALTLLEDPAVAGNIPLAPGGTSFLSYNPATFAGFVLVGPAASAVFIQWV
jgi:hypothetical protein